MIHCEKEAEISVLKTQYSFVVSELKEIKVSLRDFIDASDKKYSTTENNNFLDKRVSRLEKSLYFVITIVIWTIGTALINWLIV